MAKNKKHKKARKKASKDRPGVSLERAVARIQQMMDHGSTVTHNQWLVDRVGNRRQYDVVITGQFGGRPMLGVMECKDHKRRKGPADVEAFAKKTENLGANLRLMVSRKGFTRQALDLAKHEHIGCLSLLPDDPSLTGFSVGCFWYGVVNKWTDVRLIVRFVQQPAPIAVFSSESVKWEGKPVNHWFLRELFTTYKDVDHDKEGTLWLDFDQVRRLEIDGSEYEVTALGCTGRRVYRKKRKWVSWTGDGFYDWHTEKATIAGTIVGSPIGIDITQWDDYDGELPDLTKSEDYPFLTATLFHGQKWDESKEVPDLTKL